MTDLGTRNASQVLRTFLPQQTADLRGGIYRVKAWTGAPALTIDDASLRRRLLREITPWREAGRDGGLADDLHRDVKVEVVTLDDERGVTVERWPTVWLCPNCKRIGRSLGKQCVCGNKRWGQLHFLGYHDCGFVTEPWIPTCKIHNQVKLVSPQSTRISDIKFQCPECAQVVLDGLPYQQCECGRGTVKWNVHKARPVYTPRSLVMVNPPRPKHLQELMAAGGAARALAWQLEGMSAPTPVQMTGKPTEQTLRTSLERSGLDGELIDQMITQALDAGQLADSSRLDVLAHVAPSRREAAEHDALDLALALAESRLPTRDLVGTAGGDLAERYATSYPTSLKRAGLVDVELVESFPVMSVAYGFTRGDQEAGKGRLVAFRHPKTDGYRLHGDLAETEAYLVRLDPVRVANWLLKRGHSLPGWKPGADDPVAARVAIIAASDLPGPGDAASPATVGQDVFLLVHSFSHRMVRQAALLAGIDRDALSEYLTPLHLSFFLYAAPRGEFVLGGLQAVFETELDSLLDAVVDAEHRCPLDPGCSRGAGACTACLHLGEPSCRAWNLHLDRAALFDAHAGYLSM